MAGECIYMYVYVYVWLKDLNNKKITKSPKCLLKFTTFLLTKGLYLTFLENSNVILIYTVRHCGHSAVVLGVDEQLIMLGIHISSSKTVSCFFILEDGQWNSPPSRFMLSVGMWVWSAVFGLMVQCWVKWTHSCRSESTGHKVLGYILRADFLLLESKETVV